MPSHVYLAYGCPDANPLMKIGKTNNLSQRQSSLGLTIEIGIICDTESDAFVLEDLARAQMHTNGAKRRGTDWFDFDLGIYNRVHDFLEDHAGEGRVIYLNSFDLEELEPKPRPTCPRIDNVPADDTLPVSLPVGVPTTMHPLMRDLLALDRFIIDMLANDVEDIRKRLADLETERITLTERLVKTEVELNMRRKGWRPS